MSIRTAGIILSLTLAIADLFSRGVIIAAFVALEITGRRNLPAVYRSRIILSTKIYDIIPIFIPTKLAVRDGDV